MDSIKEWSKTVSNAEAKNLIKFEFFNVLLEVNSGAQASINIPSILFEELKSNEAIFENEDLRIKLGLENQFMIFSLSDSYKLVLSDRIQSYLDNELIDNSEYGFIIITSLTTKPQIRPANFRKANEVDKTRDYLWFDTLYNKLVKGSTISFILNSLNKELIIDFKLEIMKRLSEYDQMKVDNPLQVDRLQITEVSSPISSLPLQKLYFGAPGTGKSYNIEGIIIEHSQFSETKESFSIDDLPNVFRITIFPEYSYFDFIGSIMPIVSEQDKIEYSFKPGIFTNSLKYAIENSSSNVYLVLEEMSRGNIASIFGDIFQLLDRREDGQSRYKINNDLIAQEVFKDSTRKVYLPRNFSILGTVNTSDQNVFSMDTAFKRRFDFEYLSTEPIGDSEGRYLNDFLFLLHGKKVNWIDFYTKLNKFIVNEAKLPEDKQLGQFFIVGKTEESPENIKLNSEIIKSKLLNYLWFDVNPLIFDGQKLFNSSFSSFNDIFNAFDSHDEKIFNIEL